MNNKNQLVSLPELRIGYWAHTKKLRMDRFIKNIDKQIEFNQGKNIISGEPELFQFIDDTINTISGIQHLNSDAENLLVDYTTDKVLEEFCKINQYYSFNSDSKRALRCIYSGLFSEIRNGKSAIDEVSKNHYRKLKDWLIKYNSFAGRIYANADRIVEPVACSEYSYHLQMDIFRMDVERLMSPVLDIGCGKQGNLVHYLNSKGIEVYGIDRYKFDSGILQTSDWLEYDYGIKKWGTIISNLGFSNHFIHHNLRKDGNYIEYGKTFMNILNSLKVGGCFHYAPDLPFIEIYLDKNKFNVTQYEVTGSDFKATTITRLK
jgi:hypothetical protein